MNKSIIIFVLLISFCIFGLLLEAQEFSWEDCIIEAKKNHPDLVSAIADVNQQKAAKTITASKLYPRIFSDINVSTARTNTGAVTGAKSDSYSYGISGTQLIFDWFKTANEVNSVSENIKASRQNYRFVSSKIRFNLRAAFINSLKTQELINVAEDIVKIRSNNLGLITLRYKSGLEHKGSLLTAEANLKEANFEFSQAKRNLELAQRELIKEMGWREFKPISVQGDFIVKDVEKEHPDFEKLANSNPLVLEALAKKNSAVFSVKSAYGNFSPEFSGNANASKSNSNWPPRNEQWDAGLSVTMPIFEGGLKFAEVSRAKAIYNQTEAFEISTRNTVSVNLQQAWVSLQNAVELIDVERNQLQAAEERYKIAETQYSTGFIAFNNWIIIENELVRIKKNYLETQANALIASANWMQAKGETLEYAQ